MMIFKSDRKKRSPSYEPHFISCIVPVEPSRVEGVESLEPWWRQVTVGAAGQAPTPDESADLPLGEPID